MTCAVACTTAGGEAGAATGAGTLGAAAAATRLLQVSCFDDGGGAPASLVGQVEDLAPVAAPFVSVQLTKDGAATNGTDSTDGDGVPGPLVWINGGAGSYDVFLDKSSDGEETYAVTLQCMTGSDGGGIATGTEVIGLPAPPSVPALGGLARVLLAVGLVAAGGACRASRTRRSRP